MSNIKETLDKINESSKVKADIEDNTYAHGTEKPEGGSDKKRKADKTGGEKAMPKLDKSRGVAEALADLFDNGDDLSEEFKGKVETVFESAVSAKVAEINESLEEQFENRLNEQVELVVEELTESLDSYLDIIAEQWIKDNEIAIQSELKVEMAETFMEDLKALFVEHNIELDENESDLVAEMEEELNKEKDRSSKMVAEMVALKKANEKLMKESVFKNITEGMVETDVERFKTMTESVNFNDSEEYAKKLKTIKESWFNDKTTTEKEQLDEEVIIEDKKQVAAGDPDVSSIISAINRRVKK